ncbi:MAG: HK97 family phage prohead protease [Alphaproteobacteria bacterium]
MTGIEGYASLFGAADRSGDVIAHGAFRRTLARRRAGALPLLWQHHTDDVLGRVVHIGEDRRGLFVRAALEGGVTRAREALALMRSRTLTGLSIGFRPVRARRLKRGGRLLTEIDLWEISLVTFPMLDSARVLRVVGPSPDHSTRNS